jgi:hypothetical protein
MSSIVIAGDTSGSVTLQAPAVAGSTVLNLPSTSGTIQTSGAGYTTNGVAYATSTSALATGSALTFDGANNFLLDATGTGGNQANLRVKTDTGGAVANGYFNINGTDYFRIYTTNSETGLRNLQNTPMFFSINNTEQMRLNSIGLGIGASSPEANAKLTVYGAGIAVSRDASTVAPSGFDFKCRSANPKIGLHVTNTAQLAQIEFGTANDNSFGALINTTGADPLRFGTNNTERARITSTGNLLVGTTSAGFSNSNAITIQAAEGYCVLNHANGTGSGTNYIWFGYNGGSIGTISQNGTTAVAYNTSSDYRLKNNIAPMTGALEKVALLKPCTYKWNVDNSDGEGFIAHELAEVCPHAVNGEKDAVETYVDEDGNEQTRPVYQGIDTSFLVATLTAAIQEQQALITTLTDRITALEGV